MMAQPAARYLARFDTDADAGLSLHHGEIEDMSPLLSKEHGTDPSVLVAEAREEGRIEGLESARAEAMAEREALQRAFDAQLAAEREKWLHEQGEVLQEKVAAALHQMQETLAQYVAQILRTFVVDALRRQMLEELVVNVSSLVASHEAIAMKISGPADLLAHLQERFAGLPLAAEYEHAEGVDVLVATAQTTIETRLQAWIDLFSTRME